MGFQHFDPTLNLAGVIVNRVTSDAHYQLLKNAIEHYCSLPVLGLVHTLAKVVIWATELDS